jgi:hypothetical protein
MSDVKSNADKRIEAKNALTNVPGDSVLEAAAELGVEGERAYKPSGEAPGGVYGRNHPDK